ncbi:bifunctional cytochrome P450/NADPH--P450 reductase [Pseudarthrobacter sp. MM222]|uniref:bifunctional cytochrome P450/NADPH--P450 reductase n=1 Tax=Pseudarthrobacter sp. MM222 TaxID=3018929 RepID=UPI002220B115|nr:cytochrome P450 [Pseudarthrobacter sp. MM222]CAI3796964.1 Bifunctional cytochrome P450/NADPH--P450 reductase 2 [Pseudarthrobacter sp. MM222]
MTSPTVPIPQPPPKPVVGNLPDIDSNKGILGIVEVAERYGPIVRIQFFNRSVVAISSQQLVNEVCDESRFGKVLGRALREVRDFTGDGLFTAETQEPNWQKAHRILMPAFGPAALKRMFSGMDDIAEQLLLKWERLGPAVRIDVPDTTTRLTLDTIALCSFSYRFNSLYREEMHPFVGAMVRVLVESGQRGRRLPVQNKIMLRRRHQLEEDNALMFEVADQMISDRRRNPSPPGSEDILDTMLNAADPLTGERLPEDNVRYQMVTFLVAGHETTSGLLSFALYELLLHPGVLAKAQAQVDEVLGTESARFEHLHRLGYLDQILKETLRLWPTAPGFNAAPFEDTTLDGRYQVSAGQPILVLIPLLHRDKAAWGEDAELFEPDRFSPERAADIPANAWKPFGNGQRSCIGRGFALQEAMLFLAKLLQRFEITAADPGYELKIKHTLTMKPEGLFIHVRRRDVGIGAPQEAAAVEHARQVETPPIAAANGVPLRVLYGSNAGTSKDFAQRIANDARRRGYSPTIGPLDDAAGGLPTEGLVAVVASSYEGQPPDNARKFMAWTEGLRPGTLAGVRFTVFGNGNRDWARTYQEVPKAIDARLEAAGAVRIYARGEANARGDFFGDFDAWYAGFWPAVDAALGQATSSPAAQPGLEVQFVGNVRDPLLRQNGLALGTVVANRELVNTAKPGARSKRHVEISLPEGMRYRTGDYLAVLPLNPSELVQRALTRFNLDYDSHVLLSMDQGETFLPTGMPVAVGELLSSYLELAVPATRIQLEYLADVAEDPAQRRELESLAEDRERHAAEILDKRVSLLELLETYPSCQLSFGSFLQLLTQLAPRRYSISSSPLWSPDHATLTFSVIRAPAWSGRGVFEGAASTYLAQARPGSRVAVTVRPSNAAFHPPESLDVPLIMVCAGTGLAPFRGFIQDRALRAEAEGIQPAPALLFFGCRAPDTDFLYQTELASWADQANLDLRPVFSTAPEDGRKHVQDRLWADRADVVELVKQGATVYVCGDGKHMAPQVRDTCERIYREATGASVAEADAWIDDVERTHGRYVADIFT